MSEQRIVVWFSHGEASSVALKMAVEKYGPEKVMGVYCDLSRNEDEDNSRFRFEIERWTGKMIQFISSDKYHWIEEVFDDRRYMSGIKGAPCTVEMKKIPRFHFQEADDVHIFGFTVDEPGRIRDFEAKNPDMILEWILRDKNITKADCRAMIQFEGILIPLRYRQGFKNNNCKCCVKATSLAYWVLERRVNPDVFKKRAEQSRRIGARLTRWQGERIFLDEIPADSEIPQRFLKSDQMELISCGPECKA